MSTMRAPVLKEAWLAVERGPYLLGFSQWAGDGQNRKHTSNAPAHHVKRSNLQELYGANRDRTGDLLLAKQALSQLSYGPASPSIYALQSGFSVLAAGRSGDLGDA
jgi:hypothetical protein